MKKKIHIPLLVAGILMLLASALNYTLNEDHISLGIFAFAGIGFILLAVKESKEDQKTAQRFQKYAMTFFMLSVLILVYWFFVGKLKILS